MRDGPELAQTTITLEMEIGDSCSAIPPLMLRCGFGRTFFFTIITCSTSTLPLPGNTRSTRPCLPLSRPVITFTVSLRLMSTLLCMVCLQLFSSGAVLHLPPGFLPFLLEHLRRQRNDLQKLLFAQLARHRTKDACTDRLARLVDQHGGVLVKADVGAVTAEVLPALAHDHALDHRTFFGGSVRRGLFDGSRDYVTQAGVQAGVPAQRQDHLQPARAAIVGHIKN